MRLAEESASRSKDPTTKVGSCFVKDRRVLSLGYNGAPRSLSDDLVPFNCSESDTLEECKNSYMVHSELNAILNYNGSLRDLEDSTLYVTVFPCHECAKALVQLGIKEIIYLNDYRREEICNFSKRLLKICGVKFRKLER